MLKKLILAVLIALPLTIPQSVAQQSEDTKTRLDKQEIIDLMIKTGKIPARQQNSRIDSLWQNSSAGKTPRSDFLFCMGMAYLGNYKAQRCVAGDYERGIGIVQDLSEAYAWYGTALESAGGDEAAKQKIEADRDRVQFRLLAAYPHPAEDDLDEMVRTQIAKIAQYQEAAKKAQE